MVHKILRELIAAEKEQASASTFKLRDVRAAMVEVNKELKGISTKKSNRKTIIKKRRR